MESYGEFHEVEKDGKLYLVYHHPKYDPIPQLQSPTSIGEAASHVRSIQYLCPIIRELQANFSDDLTKPFPVNSSPEYVFPRNTILPSSYSPVPLYWCNNKEFDVDGGCGTCQGSNFGTDYYFCYFCDNKHHKECVQAPSKIKHPYHPDHSLQLYYYVFSLHILECLICGGSAGAKSRFIMYSCTTCDAFMHPICAMKLISFTIYQPKRHHHSLTLFPRQAFFICNVCGMLRKDFPTYICARCNFVAHKDCMNSPSIIKISRHHHRISYSASLSSRDWFCGVCRHSVNDNYGAYSCDKCSDYVAHSRCALGKDVCDGKDLEGVPDEDDISKDAGPFERISEGVILYFLHDHHLHIEASILFDENKFCQACTLPIFEGNFYSCMECDFIIHETCAKAPRRIQHALHPHPLALKLVGRSGFGLFRCSACDRICGGFVYECGMRCNLNLDIRCALVYEPFDYKNHEHPLFLALSPKEKLICHVCKRECHKQLNCIKCDFIICIKCATLPYNARYKHDKHFLTILCDDQVSEEEFCEVCECNLKDTGRKVFYWCSECCTTFHIECLFDEDLYMTSLKVYELGTARRVVQSLGNNNLSRPLCAFCKKRCQGKIIKIHNCITCCRICFINTIIRSRLLTNNQLLNVSV